MAGLKININRPYLNLLEEKKPLAKTKSANQWSNKTKELFYLELSVMLAAGIDIKTCLELIRGKQGKATIQEMTEKIARLVIGGLPLSEALQKTGSFTPYEFYSIQIGEETGKVSSVLSGLAEHYKKRIKLRRQMVQALSYPVVVLCTAIGAIVFMLNFIVPMFSEVFSRFGGELPVLTKIIINASHFVRSYVLFLLIGLMILFVLIYLNREKKWFRGGTSQFILRVPYLGETTKSIFLARLCEAMYLLISSRVPLVQSVDLVCRMVNFYPIEQSLRLVQKDILAGKSLHNSLGQFSIYDERFLALVKVGEEANKLDVFFKQLAVYYAEDVEHRSVVLGSLLEPLIIILLGGVVGVILLSMYLPMFELSTNM